MKRFTRLFSLILVLCMVFPLTVLAATPDYKDVPKDHWAYDSIMSLTEKGMVEGKVAGVYFDPEDNLRTTELFMTLYRLAGEPEVVPSFDYMGTLRDSFRMEFFGKTSNYIPNEGKWFCDAVLWAAENGMALVSASGYIPGRVSIPFRAGSKTRPLSEAGKILESEDLMEHFYLIDEGYNDKQNEAYPSTRSEIVVALYLYVIEYLKKEVEIENTVEAFADSDKIPALEVDQDGNATNAGETFIALPLYYNMYSMGEGHIWADAWNWAVGAGIIEGYPDNTLRPAANLTRAEYAEILERFVDYVK